MGSQLVKRCAQVVLAVIIASTTLFVGSAAHADELSFDDYNVECKKGETLDGWKDNQEEGKKVWFCEPKDKADLDSVIKRYSNVKNLKDGRTTLASSSKKLNEFLESEAGKDGGPELEKTSPALTDFGCQMADAFCKGMEDTAGAVTQWITENIANIFTWTGINTSSASWGAVLAEAAFWSGIVILVAMGAFIVGISIAMVKRDKQAIIRAVLGLGFTLPATWLSLWTVGQALDIVDGLSVLILGPSSDLSATITVVLGATIAAGAANPILAASSITGLMLCLGVLIFVNSFRTLGLQVLISFAPISFSLLPVKTGKKWVVVWASAVLALLLAQPLMQGMMRICMNGLQANINEGGVVTLLTLQSVPMYLGLLLAGLMPFLAFTMFSFLGVGAVSQMEGAGKAMGSSAAQKASRVSMQGISKGMSGLSGRGGGSMGAGGSGAGSPGGGSPTLPSAAPKTASASSPSASSPSASSSPANEGPSSPSKAGGVTEGTKPPSPMPGGGGGTAGKPPINPSTGRPAVVPSQPAPKQATPAPEPLRDSLSPPRESPTKGN